MKLVAILEGLLSARVLHKAGFDGSEGTGAFPGEVGNGCADIESGGKARDPLGRFQVQSQVRWRRFARDKPLAPGSRGPRCEGEEGGRSVDVAKVGVWILQVRVSKALTVVVHGRRRVC